MTISITSSLPRTILLGFKDDSGVAQPLEEESLPIHLPLCTVFTEWGPDDDAILVGGNGFNSIFGSNSLDYSKPYATHQTAILNAVLPQGNLTFVRRLVPADADIARIRISLDIVADEQMQYQRNPDGSYKRDSSGNLVELGTTLTGVRGRWVYQTIDTINDVYQFGQASPAEGELVNSTGETSTLYPIGDFEVRFKGGRGNNIGFRISAPTLLSSNPVDADLIQQTGAYIYRFQAVERQDSLSTPQAVATMSGEQYVDFSLKSGVVDRNTAKQYFADDVLLQAYESTDPEEFQGYGRFGRVHFYYDNIKTIQDAIYANEKDHGLVEADVTPEQTINLFGAVNASGIPYYTFTLDGPADGGLLFTENTNHYAVGGADGTLGNAALDALVRNELATFGNGDVHYLDSAVYPFSCFYDSGFSMDTKKQMGNLLQRRDVWVVVSTQDATEPLNTASEESSTAVALRSYFRNTPESDYYGTATCRVVILGHAGELIGSLYKGILPFTVAFASKSAKYMGAANGYMVDGNEFDSAPGSVVSDFKNHNATYKAAEARNVDWKNGLVFAQNFDRRSIFWPGIQTIYDDNTSILNSFFNMVIACNLTRIGERAWRNFTGNSKLTNTQFIARVDRYINDQTTGKYDNRVDVTPKSYYTTDDSARGYSWHTDIQFAGQGMKTVQTLTVVASRRDTEAEAA